MLHGGAVVASSMLTCRHIHIKAQLDCEDHVFFLMLSIAPKQFAFFSLRISLDGALVGSKTKVSQAGTSTLESKRRKKHVRWLRTSFGALDIKSVSVIYQDLLKQQKCTVIYVHISIKT